MISFFVCLALLIGGYFIYGGFVSKTFGPDDRVTPAVSMEDGVDYVVMPTWRIFLIQLLNIAGLGPIWGAVGGAMWGPSVFLWNHFCRWSPRFRFRFHVHETSGAQCS